MRQLLLMLAVTLAGCGDAPSRDDLISENEDLRGQVSHLEDEVARLEAALDDTKEGVGNVRSAANDLQNEVSRFDSDNWREVTGDVEDASGRVDRAVDDLENTAGF